GRVEFGQVLGHRLAGHGQAIAVEEAGAEQLPHDDGHPADVVEVDHHVAPGRAGVGDVRHAAADPVEVVEGEVHPGLVGDGEQVEDGVGRAAHGHRHGDGVLERLLGHDLAGPESQLEEVEDGLPGGVGEAVPAGVRGGGGGGA